jgi:hypothetical protein
MMENVGSAKLVRNERRRTMKSGFYLRVVFAGVSLMIGASAGAQIQTTPEIADKPDIKQPPEWTTLPGEFAIRTRQGYYVTAINGGGRTTDPVITTATMSVTPWEKFRLGVMVPSPIHDKSIQTSSGNYVTAVDGGGRTTDVLHTDAIQIRSWEQFRLYDLGDYYLPPTYFAIQTIQGNYLTAVGEGGKYDNAIHTDATQIGPWEYLRIVKCGDLGSGYQYTVIPADDNILYAADGGGRTDPQETIKLGGVSQSPERGWARFRFIRQSDGSYALQTYNGVNYLTALGGGGQVQTIKACDTFPFGACIDSYTNIFHTDATQVQAWEKFRFIDQGDCKYAIQTTSGFFFGLYKQSGHSLMTTRRSTITENEKFQLVMHGLASPAILGPMPAQQKPGEHRK